MLTFIAILLALILLVNMWPDLFALRLLLFAFIFLVGIVALAAGIWPAAIVGVGLAAWAIIAYSRATNENAQASKAWADVQARSLKMQARAAERRVQAASSTKYENSEP